MYIFLIFKFIPGLALISAILTWGMTGPRKNFYAGSMVLCSMLEIGCLYYLTYLNNQGLILISENTPILSEQAKTILNIFIFLFVFPNILFIVFLIDKMFYKSTGVSKSFFAYNRLKQLKVLFGEVGDFFLYYWPAYIVVIVVYVLYLTWETEPGNIAISTVYAFLLVGVSGLNIFLFGVYGSRYRILLFVFLVLMSHVGGGIFLITRSFYSALIYISLFGAACIIAFVYPLCIAAFRFEKKPIYYLPILFFLVLVSAIGSIYVPIRISSNDILMRINLKNKFNNDSITTERQREQQCIEYQDTYLYEDISRDPDVRAELESFCSVHLRRFLEDKLNVNDREICLHSTLTFWLDQFLNNCYKVRKYTQCRLTSKKPKTKGLNSLIIEIYDIFINIVWFSFFLNVLVSMVSLPQKVLKRIVHRPK